MEVTTSKAPARSARSYMPAWRRRQPMQQVQPLLLAQVRTSERATVMCLLQIHATAFEHAPCVCRSRGGCE